MESIDDAINYEEEYKTYLQGVKKNGNSLIAKCPFHDDSKPSFSVDLMTGKYHCFGCEEKGNFISFVAKVKGIDTQLAYQELCSKYNFVPPKVNFEENLENEPFCLKTYAKMKMIPLPYLEKIWKLSDSKKGIKIPYFDINENVVATRYRGENKAFRWEKNSKIVPYGLQRSLRFIDDDYVILVEGESDTQSLSLAGFSVFGIPGATMFKVEWVKYLGNKNIYIHVENDTGGTIFRNKICETLYNRNYKGKVYEMSCSTEGYKDPSDLFKSCVGKYTDTIDLNQYASFRTKIKQLMENAILLNLKEVVALANEPVPGMPAKVRIPDDYELTKDGIVYKDGKGDVLLICRIPVIISAIYYNLEDETEELEVSFYKFKRWNSFLTTRSIINNQRSILQLGEKGIPITGENAKRMSDYLGQLDELNFDTLETKKCVSQFGWWGNHFLPHYPGDINLKSDGSNKQLITGYEEEGNLDTWVEKVKPLLKNDLFNCMLKVSFASPLIKLLRARLFITHFWADSRAGKTAALKVALSVWGNPDATMGNFNSTSVGIERMASLYNDLPFGIDEKQAVGNNKDFINNLVYMLGLGQGRTRGTKTGSIQSRSSWNMAIITTGEEPITSETSQTGISSRTLELYGPLFDRERDAIEMHRFTTKNYGLAGRKYIKYIIENIVVPKSNLLDDLYDFFCKTLEEDKEENISSHIASVSLICVADYISNLIIFDIDDIKATLCFGKRILEKLETQKETDIVDKAYNYIKSWIIVNVNYFSPLSKTQIYGTHETIDGVLYYLVQPSILQQELTKQGYNYKKVMKGFNERGYILIESSQRRNTIRRTSGGTTTAYIAIRVDEDMKDITPTEQMRIEDVEWTEAMELSHEADILKQKIEEHKKKRMELERK